ncbi:hypothetical protein DPMN_186691 [Dreissena polymorpha]|uniref:Uncharacterized protein n=1 Tax=Dreissena polymorpha TaxID=45954 RepID=A0A9D4I6R6_DREPO|nr:hypothetical protein DPMN_186691 [Dreissena polymorpha]
MLSKSAQRALIGWEAHGTRIMTASFLTKKKRVSVDIIQGYSSQNNIEEGEQDKLAQ